MTSIADGSPWHRTYPFSDSDSPTPRLFYFLLEYATDFGWGHCTLIVPLRHTDGLTLGVKTSEVNNSYATPHNLVCRTIRARDTYASDVIPYN